MTVSHNGFIESALAHILAKKLQCATMSYGTLFEVITVPLQGRGLDNQLISVRCVAGMGLLLCDLVVIQLLPMAQQSVDNSVPLIFS